MSTKWKVGLSVLSIMLLWGLISVAFGGVWYITVAMIALVLSLVWSGKEAKLLKMLAGLGLAVMVVGMLFAAKATGPTARWFYNRAEEKAPRDNFDPKAEEFTPMAVFYRGIDGTIHKVSPEWKWNPEKPEPIARPGSAEYMDLLFAYEKQRALGALEEHPAATTTRQNTCRYCVGSGCEQTALGEILGPGRMQIRSEQYGTTAQFSWNLAGKGAWSQPFPDDAGEFQWESAEYGKGLLRGTLWSTKKPDGKYPIVLTCSGPIPPPNS